MKKFLIASGVAVLAFASVAGAASTVFSTNLTVGSTGADVVALQSALISAGNDIPAISSGAAAKGYFGSQTKTAVKAYQTAKGIPSTGFVGPLTRAALNGSTSTVAVATCPVGFTCTANAGTTVTGTIKTIGAEGTLTVTASNAGLPSSVYEGDSKAGVFGFKAEAKTSDILIQRVKINLGNSSSIYNKVANKIYVLDGSNVVGSADLNSNTVVKESNNYYSITVTGLNVLVSKDSSKILTVAVDVNSSVDSAYRSGNKSYPIGLWNDPTAYGVRGVDGAGIDQYSGFATTRTLEISTAQADASTLKVSTNSATPKAGDVIASAGTNKNEADKVTTLVFNVKAEKDTVKITDLIATSTGTAVGNGYITTAYLFDGQTEIDNATVNKDTGLATFNNLDIEVAKDTSKVLTIKVDVRNAGSEASDVTTSVVSSGIVAENSKGDDVSSYSGSATGNALSIKDKGAIITLVSKSTSVAKNTNNNGESTSTLSATFTFNVKASGKDLVLGTVASTTPFTDVNSFTVYTNGIDVDNAPAIVSFSTPSDSVTVDDANDSFTIADGNDTNITVVAKISVSGSSSINDYAVQVTNLLGSTFMNKQSDWRTAAVNLP